MSDEVMLSMTVKSRMDHVLPSPNPLEIVLDGNAYHVPSRLIDRAAIKRDLTIKLVDHNERIQRIPIYKDMGVSVVVPRLYGLKHYGKPTFERVSEGREIVTGEQHYTLYPAQKDCVAAISFDVPSTVEGGRGHSSSTTTTTTTSTTTTTTSTTKKPRKGIEAVLNLACGKGKTHIGIHAITLI